MNPFSTSRRPALLGAAAILSLSLVSAACGDDKNDAAAAQPTVAVTTPVLTAAPMTTDAPAMTAAPAMTDAPMAGSAMLEPTGASPERPVVAPVVKARQGVTGHNVRYVLGYGIVGTVVAFIIVYLVYNS